MSETTKTVLKVIGVIVLGYIALKIVLALAIKALFFALPFVIIGAIGYVIYTAATGKSLLGGKRTLP